MRKYRILESKLKKDLDEVKENINKLDQETKKVPGVNEEIIDLIKNCSLDQLIEMNK